MGSLDSTRLDISDPGPLVGSGHAGDGVPTAGVSPAADRVLARKAFRTGRWNHMDADVTFNAGSSVFPEALPLHKLSAHLQLRKGQLTLSPLRFDLAGGTLAGSASLDGRAPPIRATAALKARQLRLAQLFPAFDRSMTSIGEFNGNVDLKGQGDTAAAMPGSADGQAVLLIGTRRGAGSDCRHLIGEVNIPAP